MGEEPFLYLMFESTYVVSANGIVVHQEIGVFFVLFHQVAHPVRFIFAICPIVGGRWRSKRMVLVRSRVKVGVACGTRQ
jgi:hypothetical protein